MAMVKLRTGGWTFNGYNKGCNKNKMQERWNQIDSKQEVDTQFQIVIKISHKASFSSIQ